MSKSAGAARARAREQLTDMSLQGINVKKLLILALLIFGGCWLFKQL
jgi:hypothetical protein